MEGLSFMDNLNQLSLHDTLLTSLSFIKEFSSLTAWGKASQWKKNWDTSVVISPKIVMTHLTCHFTVHFKTEKSPSPPMER